MLYPTPTPPHVVRLEGRPVTIQPAAFYTHTLILRIGGFEVARFHTRCQVATDPTIRVLSAEIADTDTARIEDCGHTYTVGIS